MRADRQVLTTSHYDSVTTDGTSMWGDSDVWNFLNTPEEEGVERGRIGGLTNREVGGRKYEWTGGFINRICDQPAYRNSHQRDHS